MMALLAACQEEHHAEAPAPRPVLAVVVARRRRGPWVSPEPSSPGTSPTSAFGCSGASSAVTSMWATSSGRGSACHARPARLPAGGASAQADLASATARLENAASTETRQRTLLQASPPRRSDAAEQARESAEAGVTSARATSTRPRSNSATPSFAPTSTVSSPPPRLSSGRWSSRDKRSSRLLARTSGRRSSTCPRASGGISGRRPASTSPCSWIPRCGLPGRCGRSHRRRIRHPHAAGEDPSTTRRTVSVSERRSPQRSRRRLPRASSCRPRPCWSATAGRWSGSSIRPPGRCRPGT